MTRQTSTLAGGYLALFTDITFCDGACGLEARITTDGIDAYAVTDLGSELNVGRVGTVLSAECQHDVRGNVCHGRYEWHLDRSGWTSDPSAKLAMRHAERIDT